MKKILQSLMTLAMLLGITQFGQAQETTYSVPSTGESPEQCN